MQSRIPGHKAKGGEPNPSLSYAIVLRSDDGGKTWLTAYDLRDCMMSEDRVHGGMQRASVVPSLCRTEPNLKGTKVDS